MKQAIKQILFQSKRIQTEMITTFLRAPMFFSLLKGTQIKLANGETILVKVKKIETLGSDDVPKFSRYTYVTTIGSGDGDIEEKGWGSGDFKLLALQKSLSEALERLIFRILKNKNEGTQTSNGWSCHLSRTDAARSSFEELAERDAILVHWLSQLEMKEISGDTFPNSIQRWVREDLSLHPTLCNLRILLADKGYLPVAVVILQSQLGASVVAHSSGKNLKAAIDRALDEACLLARNINGKLRFESSRKLALGHLPWIETKPQDHNLLYAYHSKLPDFLFGNKIDWQHAKQQWAAQFELAKTKTIDFTFHEIVSFPLVVGFGESSDFQNLYFGSTSSALGRGAINFSRLNLERGQEINLRPHFIG